MAKFNLKYYTGEDSYSDGDIEERILEIVKAHKSLEDLEDLEVNYPILYHLSHVRQNILVWYPFKEHARVLEVGSGCGALTGLLCQRVKSVTSVELSKRRATINYERNKSYHNLEIVVGNLNDIVFPEKFDYIVLNGVFEYAASFTDSETPYETFLSAIAEKLEDTGTILIAIENRLGAKYFAGAPEDHVNQYFCGINQYPDIKTVRTFSKSEFQDICFHTGLVCGKFYYPYPDYKFPYEIFTDKTINGPMYGTAMFQFDANRLNLIQEDKLNRSLAKEKVADIFANSFLVEVRKQETQDEADITYVKINSDRSEEFRLYTVLWEGKTEYVTKHPIGEKARKHILNMQGAAKRSDSPAWRNLEGTVGKDHEIVYPMLKEPTLDEIAAGYAKERKTEKITELLQEVEQTFFKDAVYDNNYQTEEFQKVFGLVECERELKCVKHANIDIILDNIFCKDGIYVLIDTEWIFPFAIPCEYIMWRVINELFYKHQELYQMMDYNGLLEQFGILPELEPVFRKWEMHFAYQHVKGHGLKKYAKPMLEMKKIIIEHIHCSKMYLNTGRGYNEEDVAYSQIEYQDGRFKQVFQLPEEEILSMRWDPTERPCICKVMQIHAKKSHLRINPLNAAYTTEEGDMFLTMDPNYEIGGKISPGTKLTIRGEIHMLESEEIIKGAEPLWQKDETVEVKDESRVARLKRRLREII